ncbi:MAG: hypothetical protein KGR70_16560 [Cyanobacteria bacterium REEB494]|nr:hypothetical protein [Cyanobacteria bacterium REEB494]
MIALHPRRAIAKHSLREIAFRVPRVSSQGKILNVLRGDREALPTGDRIQGSPCFFSRENPECVEGRLHCIPDGRSRSTPDGRSQGTLSSRHVSCSVPGS